jgi:uncharacterized protein YegP (UPF0339 family)
MALKRPRINYWQSKRDQRWYFNLQGKNGKIVAQSEGYSNLSNCKRAMRKLRWMTFFARPFLRSD